jgi:hypothetical protein
MTAGEHPGATQAASFNAVSPSRVRAAYAEAVAANPHVVDERTFLDVVDHLVSADGVCQVEIDALCSIGWHEIVQLRNATRG